MIWACWSSGKNERSALRISPWLSYRRNLTHSWLPRFRSAGMAHGQALRRDPVRFVLLVALSPRTPLGALVTRPRRHRVERVPVVARSRGWR